MRQNTHFPVCSRITSKVDKWVFFKNNVKALFISNNILTPRKLFCNNHKNKYYFVSILRKAMKELGANCFLTLNRTRYTCSYSMLHPHNFMNTDDLVLI